VLGESFEQTLGAARMGAEWAWASIYRDLAPTVRAYLRGRGAGEADDLVGEVFLQVVRDLPRFAGSESDFRAWVFVIAGHRLIDDARRRARRPVELGPEVGVHMRGPDDVETRVLEEAAAERVRRIIGQLAPDQRDVLLLRVLGQLTVEEVADVTGKSRGAVKALQRRGLAAIQLMLSREGVTL
jgi:RNA polymerase sigma factor (sigma-70 family)